MSTNHVREETTKSGAMCQTLKPRTITGSIAKLVINK
jgi:hypothetical protein